MKNQDFLTAISAESVHSLCSNDSVCPEKRPTRVLYRLLLTQLHMTKEHRSRQQQYRTTLVRGRERNRHMQ